MIIVIDARESGTSTGRYEDKLIEYLHLLKPPFDITVLTKQHRLDFLKHIAPTFTIVESPYKEFTFAEQLGLKKQLNSLHPDLVHFGMVQQPILYKGRVVTTMHDLIMTWEKSPVKNPVVHWIKQQVYKWVNKRAARKSAAVITPSQFVKNAVVQFTGITPDKVTVTYESADPIPNKPEPITNLIDKPFLMYVGRPSPHKNLERLIEAFVVLKAKHPDLYLVLAGKKDSNYQRIEKLVASRDIADVIFTDFISEGQLRWLYEHCAAYVFPSLSEGFGLPGLEAMQHGAPVVSSNATCLPEIYGDAAHYFPPTDIPAMATAINDVLTDTKLRQTLITAGKAQAQKYSWRRMAEQTLDVYKQVLGNT
jgi:glycosyltransferase involved in cell wall biosynthesis